MPLKLSQLPQFGVLASSITSGATSITLASGQGARFDSFSAGDVSYAVIIDEHETSYARFEFVKITARAGDVLTVERGKLGTSGIAFPIGVGDPSEVKVAVSDNIGNLLAMVDGGGAIIQATAPTLTAFSARNVILNPAAPITVALPTTDVWAGLKFNFVNLGTDTITINASGGGKVLDLPAGRNVVLSANQDAPTTAAHWSLPATYFQGVAVLEGPTITPGADQVGLGVADENGAGTAWLEVETEGGDTGFPVLASAGLLCKVIDIGDWDMDATASVAVAHGLTLANIRSVSAIIRKDDDSDRFIAQGWNASATDFYIGAVNSNVNLARLAGGSFDNTNYDSTGFNRGWIVIWYVP